MILCLGFSHQTTPLALRERLALSAEGVADLLRRFASRQGAAHAETAFAGLCELAVLSTCNRFEFYVCLPEEGTASGLMDLLCEARGVSRAVVEPGLYRYRDHDAVMHLCRVAAGLESQVLGEAQILGQVTEAYQMAQSEGTAGRVLSAVFQAAIRAGKRAHTETSIGRNASTVSSAAIRLAEQQLGTLAGKCALVVGAGKMGALAVRALRSHGVRHILVTNRTQQAALTLAEQWDSEAVAFGQLPQALEKADLVIVCTSARQPVVDVSTVRRAQAARNGRELVVVDIAVPRNVAPEVADVPGVRVLNLDHLNSRVHDGLRERAVAIPKVEQIVQQEVAEYDDWLNELDALNLIADLHKKADAIRQRELQRTLRHLPDLDPQSQAHIQHLAQSLMDKLLHEPTQRLRDHDLPGSAKRAVYVDTVRELFGLDVTTPQQDTGACQ